MRVVVSVSSDTGVKDAGGAGTKSAVSEYSYRDLRGSRSGRGPQGFGKVIVQDPSGVVTTTTYAQGYPYTGMPLSVVREYHGRLVTETTTDYCDNIAPAGSEPQCSEIGRRPSNPGEYGVFVYPKKVSDVSHLQDTDSAAPGANAEVIETTTQYVYDRWGNPATTTVTISGSRTGETYEKKTENDYGPADGIWATRGKPWGTTATSRRVVPGGGAIRTHKTGFQYGPSPMLALTKKIVEPDAEVGSQLHTAYDYDDFGNLITTTSCASDFGNCTAGQDNPQGDPNDPAHPPFRTTTVSYYKNAFTPGPTARVQSLPYGDGRYPVKTTNALNQTQYSAYDPRLGVLVQSTGPNGIHTCYEYDGLGYKTSETARCGSLQELKTTVSRYLVKVPYDVNPVDPSYWTLTLTTEPSGTVSGGYADELGRAIETFSYGFKGVLTHVKTEYDDRGRVANVSKPYLTGETPLWTSTNYDWQSRPETVTQELGVIDGGASPTTAVVTTSYTGSKSKTTQMVGTEERTRTEWKNVLGKVSQVDDALGSHIWYAYDADGSLTSTTDHSNNQVLITYDSLGRKTGTQDPDLGSWTYGYNGFGDLISQTNAKGAVSTMRYDRLGRMTSKTDSAGTAEWVYDKGPGGIGKLAAMISAPDPKLKAACSVPDTTQTSGNRAGRWFDYTEFGEVKEATECVDGEVFSTQYEYDQYGRQLFVRYPEVNYTRFAARYHYSSSGYLDYVADASDGKPYWVAQEMNAAGQVTKEQTRNGVEVVSKRNPSTGWLLESTATAKAINDEVLQSWEFTYDAVGNLRSRGQSMSQEFAAWEEDFTYDKLDRLLSSEVKIPSADYHMSEAFTYDRLGNLTWKGGKQYIYTGCNAGPHAVCQVGAGTVFAYDANGNMTSGQGRTVQYNPANKPSRIENTESHATAEFIYGADGHRVVQSVGQNGSEVKRTVYVGLGGTGKSIYERTTDTATGAREHVQFLYAGSAHGGNAFALRIPTEGSSSVAMKYNLFDHLGSVTAMSDEYGQVIGPSLGGADATVLGYDAWGARRNPDGSVASTAFNLQVGHREYTSHETIPNLGLVNMNGRVYDPELGRFLTPDPNVQFVANLQSYNRYSYVANNPLRYTDPTGYAWYSFLTSASFYMGLVEAGFAGMVCVAGGPATCAAITIGLAVMQSTAMIVTGAPWQAVVFTGAVSAIAGMGVGAAFGAATNPAWQVVTGAISGAVSGAISTAVFGGSLGDNMLQGALTGAAAAAVTWAVKGVTPVSQSSVAEQQGGAEGQRRQSGEPLTAKELEIVQKLRALSPGEDVPGNQRLSAGDVLTVNKMIAKGSWNEAIEYLHSHYDLPLGGTYADIGDDEGKYSQGRILVGKNAFQQNGRVSAENLYATLAHENVHYLQDIGGRLGIGQAHELNEVEAYIHDLRNARAYGLNRSQVQDLEIRLYDHFATLRHPEIALSGNWGYYK
jgi:RHS repeat-associated protein